MKKILIILIMLTIVLNTNVYAKDYELVNVTTSFSEDIDFSLIPQINLFIYPEGIDYIDDGASVKLMVELTEKNNYTSFINNINIVDEEHLFCMVDGDSLGNYNCTINVNNVNDNQLDVNLLLTHNNNEKNPNTAIPIDVLEKIYGTTNKSNNNDSKDNEIVISSSTTTKISEEERVIEESKKREEKKKKEEIKRKNDMVSFIVFSLIGIVIFVGIIISLIKIKNANK